MLVIDRSVRRFATNDAAAKFIADLRTLKAQQSRPSRSRLWQAQSVTLLAHSQPVKTGEAEVGGETSAFKDWIPVMAATSATRGRGHPVARWHRSDHKVLKRVAHE